MRSFVHDREQIVRRVRCFRGREKEEAAGPQGKVERLDEPFLHRPIQVDQEVAAGNQIEVRERWIADDVVRGEQHELAQLTPDPVATRLPQEEALQALLGEIGDVRVRIEGLSRGGNRLLVEIGGEHLDLRLLDRTLSLLGEQHGNRIGLLAGGARRHPDANLIVAALVLDDLRQHLRRQRVERQRVAEEIRDADEQFLHQRHRFLGVLAQEPGVGLEIRKVPQVDAASHPPMHRARLVIREIVTGANAEHVENLPHRIGSRRGTRGEFSTPAVGAHLLVEVVDALWHLGDRQDQIDQSGGDGIARHVAVFRQLRILHDNEPTVFLDALQP